MSEEELNEKVGKLERKKISFTRNRSLCAVVTVFLGYNFYNTIQQDTPPVWFLFVMSAIIIICAALGLYGHKIIKQIEIELAELSSQQNALSEIEENTTE